MRDEVLNYYERELSFLRRMGADFASRYPKIASRLLLEPNRCEDPHVERLIEAFSLLAARIQLKLDDEFPEITQSLLNVVYPHYVRPIPSMAVAEFRVDPKVSKLTEPLVIPRESLLYSRPVDGLPCKFRTCYETAIWPLRVVEAQWRTPDRLDPPLRAPDAAAALRVELACWPGVTFSGLNPQGFRFYLDGESNLVHSLYELLCNNCRDVVVRNPRPKFQQAPLALPVDAVSPVGFAENEGLLPYPRRSFLGYRLLQEYAAFPEKFFFFDLRYMEALRYAGLEDRAEIVFLLSPFERAERQEMLEAGVSAKTFRLGCAPVVNLFPQVAEPVLLEPSRFEYPVVPDVRHRQGLEVFSVDQVVSTSHADGSITEYQPFFSFRHAGAGPRRATFYHAARRQPGGVEGPGEVHLSLVDLSGKPVTLEMDTLTVRCTCTNGDLPSRLPFGSEQGDFLIEGTTAVSAIVALRKPTPTHRPPLGGAALWRLISHLSLNYLSLVEEGKEALQEILKLYQASSAAHLDLQIQGILSVASRRHMARVVSEHGISFVRGLRVEMELDEDKYVGGGAYLFASVLERFLAQYVSMNSFSQLVVRTRQRKEALRQWDPRAGNRILL
ncbi:MAG: type VI secretion system baseplate subunit TssF [Bryobacteraceae bacterium]|nr:type VI secretion system baseplate subunit TssF [Bryobacteraceae bacterium]